MPRRTLTHEEGDYRVMASKLLVLAEGIPGSTEKPARYEEYEGPRTDERGNYTEGEVVHLTAEDATRHSANMVAVFVNPTSDYDRRVRLVPTVVPVGSEAEVLARAPVPGGVAVVVPPEMTPEGAGQAPVGGQPGTERDVSHQQSQPESGPVIRAGQAGTPAEEPTGTPPGV